MSSVPTGPPISPPLTMPTIAAATATVAAPGTPACSNAGAKASPVAGPPVRVTEPVRTPNSGCMPSGTASAIPTTFCSTARTVDSRKKMSTCGPPTRSSDRLAAKPMVVKNAIIIGVWSRVSNTIGSNPRDRAVSIAAATSSPPMTGAGTL